MRISRKTKDYRASYQKENYKTIKMTINPKKDEKLWLWYQNCPNKIGTIKKAIAEYIEKHGDGYYEPVEKASEPDN